MIAGEALADWLSDPLAQRRSLDAAEASARKWLRHPWMQELRHELSLIDPDAAPGILDVARRFTARLGDIEAVMRDMIASCRVDPFFLPPLPAVSSDIHSGLLLFHDRLLSIALGISGVDLLAAKKAGKRGATSIGFTGLLTSFRYIRSGNATMSFWEAPPIADQFVMAEARPARFVERRRIEDGEEIVMDGRYQTFIIEHAEADVVYLQSVVRTGGSSVATEHDSKTLECIGATSTDEAASRIQMMVSLLRAMEVDEAVPTIIEALDSPHFYTRWYVMRELLAMDADAALLHLRRMADADPHPEIRATAARTLAMFFAEEEAVACRA